MNNPLLQVIVCCALVTSLAAAPVSADDGHSDNQTENSAENLDINATTDGKLTESDREYELSESQRSFARQFVDQAITIGLVLLDIAIALAEAFVDEMSSILNEQIEQSGTA